MALPARPAPKPKPAPMLRREDRSTPVLAPLPLSAHRFPSLSLLSGSLDQLLSSAMEMEADDDESLEERIFLAQLETCIGRGVSSKRRRSESISGWGRDCRACVGVAGLLEVEVLGK